MAQIAQGSGRWDRKPFRHSSSLADALTPIILLLYLAGLSAAAVYGVASLSDPNSPAATNGMTAGAIWTGTAVAVITFAAIAVPLLLLGLWLTSLFFKFDLAGGAYFRAAAVAALPLVLLFSLFVLPRNPVLIIVVLALAAPLSVLLAKGSFGLNLPETAGATVVAGPLCLAGLLASASITKMATAAGVSKPLSMVTPAPPAPASAPSRPQIQPSLPQYATPTPIPAPPVSSPPVQPQDILARIGEQTDALLSSEITPSRVSFLRTRASGLRMRLDALRGSGDPSALNAISQRLDAFNAKLQTAAAQTDEAPPAAGGGVDAANPAPVAPDAVASALATLDNGTVFKRRDALKALAALPRDPAKTEITRKLEQIVLSEEFALRDDASTALKIWADGQTVIKLLPWLDEETWPPTRIDTAMSILAATKDKRAVLPIIRWIIKRSDQVITALTAMGPVAEDELDKTIREPNAVARRSAARILQEIGGQKSLIPLQRAAADARDVSAQQAAKIALEVVRERWKAAKATTQPKS